MREPFPVKPKGMHWKTYSRLYALHEAAFAQYMGTFALEAGRLMDRLDAIADRERR